LRVALLEPANRGGTQLLEPPQGQFVTCITDAIAVRQVVLTSYLICGIQLDELIPENKEGPRMRVPPRQR